MDPLYADPFELNRPEIRPVPFLFNAPHSGRDYPRTLLKTSRLDPVALRRSEDAFIDEIFRPVTARGATFLRARFPRAYVDVNREPYELDPTMFDGDLPVFANTRSMRVAGGLGTIARIVSESEEIYDRPIPIEDGLKRISRLYKPYHRAMRDVLDALHRKFGVAILIDCHSMPSLSGESTRRPDFVLGDRFGTSCASPLIDIAHDSLRRKGYRVARNKPYAGGYITETYGQPSLGFHALQIEVNRGLYMDETHFRRTGGFGAIKSDLLTLCDDLIAIPPGDFSISAAAE